MVAFDALGTGGAVDCGGLKGEASQATDTAGIGVLEVRDCQAIGMHAAIQIGALSQRGVLMHTVSQPHALNVRLDLLH